MEILYFFDVLCGWCYGFSPVIKTFEEKHKDKIRFHVFSGGMMTGDRMGPLDQVAPYVKAGAYKDVEQRTGVKFGEQFKTEVMEPGTAIFSSLEPAIVLGTFKSFESGFDIPFASAMQHAVYYDGVLPTKMEDFIPYAEPFGIDLQEFKYRLSQPAYHDKAYDDFKICQQFGIQGFPTTVLVYGDKYYMLSHGYVDLNSLETRMESIIAAADANAK